MALNKECPVCKQNGGFGKLQKFNINFEESITLCENEKCTYPLGLIKTNDLIGKRKSQAKERPCAKKPALQTCVIKATEGLQKAGLQVLPKTSGQMLIPKPFGKNVHPSLLGYSPGQPQKTVDPATGTESKVLRGYTLQHTINGTKGVNGYTATVASMGSLNLSQHAQGVKVQNFSPPTLVSVKASSANSTDTTAGSLSSGSCQSSGHLQGTAQLLPAVLECLPKTDKLSNAGVTGPPVFDIQKPDFPLQIENKSVNDLECKRPPVCTSGIDLKLSNDARPLTKDVNLEDGLEKWFLQWENQDALCWLDVVLCLLVQSRSVRNAVDVSRTASLLTHSSAGTPRKTYIVRTLLAAYDQAMELGKSLNAQREKQKAQPKIEKEEIPVNGRKPCRKSQLLASQSQGKPNTQISTEYTVVDPGVDVPGKGKMGTIMSKIEPEQNSVSNCILLKMGAGQSQSPGCALWAELIVTDAEFVKARSMMNEVREQVWQELQPKLQCEKGRKDSPVFAIPLLLHTDPDINHLFKTTYKFETKCNQCGNTKIERYTKVLPTLPKVVEEFSMCNVSHLRDCFFCRAPNQKRQLHFEKLAQCVMIHFVEGLPSSDLTTLNFTLSGQSYQVTSVIQYKTDPSHFVIWIKHPTGEYWMECDDLDGPLCKFEGLVPRLPASQIHVVFWERVKSENNWTESLENIYEQPRQKTEHPFTRSTRRKNSSSAVSTKDACNSQLAECDAHSIESLVQPRRVVRENIQPEVTKSSVTNEAIESQEGKAAPPVGVRKTFALLKQMSSQITPSIKQSNDGAGNAQSIDTRASRNTRKTSKGSCSSIVSKSVNVKSGVIEFVKPLSTSAPRNCSVSNSGVSKTLQISHTKTSSTKKPVTVFEGYKSKVNAAQTSQKKLDTHVGKDVSNNTLGHHMKVLSTLNIDRDDKSCVRFSQPSNNMKQSSALPTILCGKRKTRTAVSVGKKSRLSKVVKHDGQSNFNTGTSLSAESANKITLSTSEKEVESAESANKITLSTSEKEVDTANGANKLAEISEREDQSLEDIMSELVTDVLPVLPEEIKGDNSDSDAQAEILKDLYKALDLNITPELEEKKELYQMSDSLSDAWNSFDTLFSV